MGAVLDLHAGLDGAPPGAAARALPLSSADRLEALLRGSPGEAEEALLPRGRLVEICASPRCAGSASWAAAALREVQEEGSPVAWIQHEEGDLYPPDLERAGIDLAALAVLRIPRAAKPTAAPQAAEHLLRTGAFGALVLDLSVGPLPRGQAWQGRLLSLARQHQVLLLLLSPRAPEEPSLGPLISLRLVPGSERLGPGRFRLQAEIKKNKSGLHFDRRSPGLPKLPLPPHRRPSHELPVRMAESPPGLW